MIHAVTANVTLDLFNELVWLDPTELSRSAQIEWTLLAQVRQSPGDPSIRVALIQALCQQGKASQAIEQADIVWHHRRHLDDQVLATFRRQLANLGLYERALQLLDAIDSDAMSHIASKAGLAFLIGDIERAFAEAGPVERDILARIRRKGLDTVFAAHQGIVRQAMSHRQTFAGIRLVPSDDDDTPEYVQNYYISAPFEERSALEWQIFQSLEPLYARAGLNVADALDLYTPMVMDVSNRPAARDL